MAEIFLVRHGQTEWSLSGRHTSVTDLDLTAAGEEQALRLRPLLAPLQLTAVLCSPRRRAKRTAELAGLPPATIDEDLAEWAYGDYEGVTSARIHETDPGWTIWHDGAPGGESPAEVGVRLDRVLAKAEGMLAMGDVALVGHGHALRVAAARWIGLGAEGGELLWLDTATVSVLGFEHERKVIRRWNLAPATIG
ncbi:histidine phosphatase family protein [Phytomonospora endophytica]|uniref:Putative phosphoglycerate mutase n=1 Tax=Phytomonospora endophytica TaxID=714109 RepID=A0A841FL96_9ACTN|nr:histidine phosphatase family protein [Phytomonospora endophytica]MBB6036634.1 putative phosphoglycerate mutase [Phytomonospora endophytica]GIG65955.1 phosphoglycerate mutase [Phytomonospora endophytica]